MYTLDDLQQALIAPQVQLEQVEIKSSKVLGIVTMVTTFNVTKTIFQ